MSIIRPLPFLDGICKVWKESLRKRHLHYTPNQSNAQNEQKTKFGVFGKKSQPLKSLSKIEN